MIDPAHPFNPRPITSYAQNLEDVMLWRALGHVEAGFYIDVGANDPVADSVTLAFYERGWRGINIEPIAARLQALQAARPGDTNLGCAVSDRAGEMTLWQMQGHGLSTLDGEIARSHQAKGESAQQAIQVPVQTLAQVCEQHATGREIHFLKVDVEGLEAQVLAGADFTRFRPWVLVMKATLPNSQVTVHEAWEPLLTGQGYRFAYTDGINRFYVAAEQAQLLPALAHPPNVFDRYTRVRERDALAQAAHWQAQAAQLRAQLQAQLQTQAAQLATAREQATAAQLPGVGRARRRLWVDVTGHEAGASVYGTGRVVHQMVAHWLARETPGVDVVPVHRPALGAPLQYADGWERLLCGRGRLPTGERIEVRAGDDIFLLSGMFHSLPAYQEELQDTRRRGARVQALLLDLLPIFLPDCFPAGFRPGFEQGVRVSFGLDGVIAISEKTARDFQTLVQANHIQLPQAFKLAWCHLGCDVVDPGEGAAAPWPHAALRPQGFVMAVANIEPRKGYPQLLAAFERLWRQGSELQLVIVGQHVWLMEAFCEQLAAHPEMGRRLFWLRNIDNPTLATLYQNALGLVAASRDEGFGLPLVEALRHGCPVLARDIPIFRETSWGMAQFFSGDSAEDLAPAVAQWLATAGQRPRPDPLHPGLKTWAQAAANLQHLVLADA